MIRATAAAAIAALAIVPLTQAALTGVTQTASSVGVDALAITDGSWDFYGGALNDGIGDYGLWNDSIWMRETWIGAAGAAVGFDTSVSSNTLLTSIPISINKNVTNTAGFDFTAYSIRLIAQGGTTMSDVNGFANADYSDVTVTEVVAGIEYLIEYNTVGSDLGTLITQNTTFGFDFEISGGVDFEIIQVAIPSPGAFALAGVAGIAVIRRRR